MRISVSRWAIGWLTVAAQAASPAGPADWLAVVRGGGDEAARARALQQLAVAGAPEALPELGALLGDPRLGQYARDALQQRGDDPARAVLRAALDRLTGPARTGVIGTLGHLGDAAATGRLVEFAGGTDDASAVAALLALGRIGNPAAREAVVTALRDPRAERREAGAEAALRIAEARRETEPAGARELFALVAAAEVPPVWRGAGARGTLLLASDAAPGLLAVRLREGDAAERDLVLGVARELGTPGVGVALAGEVGALPTPWQAAVAVALADLGGPAALAALEALARDGQAEAREAAITALGRRGVDTSVPLLLAATREDPAGALAAAAWAALVRVPAAGAGAALLAEVPTAAPERQAKLISTLGERRFAGAADALLRLAAGAEPVAAAAALRALGQALPPERLADLVQLAPRLADEERRTLADRAIVTTAMKVADPVGRAEPLRRAFEAASDPATRRALVRPLGALMRATGGRHEVFFSLQAALSDPDPGVRAAVLGALAAWPDAAPVATLLAEAARPETSAAERGIALAGALRLASNVAAGRERSPLDVVATFRTAAGLARTPAERRDLVGSLASLRHPDVAGLLAPHLGDPEVREEAALALVQAAAGLVGPAHLPMMRPLLERVAREAKDDDVRRRAARLARGEAPAPKGKAAKAGASLAPVASAGVPGPLFNGIDLTGWDGDPGVWRVEDGVILGGNARGNPRNEFLAMTRRTGDFVLRLEYRLTGTEGFVNGGVQVRSERIADPEHEMSGYQADIGAGHSGSLYDESRRRRFLARATEEQVRRLERPGEWNRYEIRCTGPRVEIFLNGERTVDYTETEPGVVPAGRIALQIHGKCKAEIAFRKLELEER
jgi:HEAT repeat protein